MQLDKEQAGRARELLRELAPDLGLSRGGHLAEVHIQNLRSLLDSELNPSPPSGPAETLIRDAAIYVMEFKAAARCVQSCSE